MNSDSIICRLFNLHKYNQIYNSKRYLINKCDVCGTYKVLFKDYSIESKFKSNELPKNIKRVLI